MQADDALDVVKSKLKNLLGSAYYTVGVRFIAPSYPFNYRKAIRKYGNPSTLLIVDLGCGNYRIDPDIVALDGTDYDAVDIVADLNALPFADGSIDILSSRSALEHVAEIERAVDELKRCTKSGGFGVHFVPFIYPFHASPHDYSRWTPAGFPRLFADWPVVEQTGTTGPISLFLICFIDFMSTLFSLVLPRLKGPMHLLLCLLLFPIKFLDAPFVGQKAFLGLTSTFLNAQRKP